jgi:hypothetical protein
MAVELVESLFVMTPLMNEGLLAFNCKILLEHPVVTDVGMSTRQKRQSRVKS